MDDRNVFKLVLSNKMVSLSRDSKTEATGKSLNYERHKKEYLTPSESFGYLTTTEISVS